MNQDELIERLKEVAEYHGCTFENGEWKLPAYINPKSVPERFGDGYCLKYTNEADPWDLKYHTSFDWSVPVWSKVFKEYPEIAMNYSLQAAMYIDDNNPLQFFINLSDLIREIKKYNGLSGVFKEARSVVKKEQDKYNTDGYNELLKEAKKNQ